MSKGIVGKALDNPVQLAIGLGIVVGIVYFFGRALTKQVAAAAGGLVSGNNAITDGTGYAGKGVAGTLGAAANSASGGALESIGEALGSWFFDATHTEYDPNTGFESGAKTVRKGGVFTDELWGRVGSVQLRAQ